MSLGCRGNFFSKSYLAKKISQNNKPIFIPKGKINKLNSKNFKIIKKFFLNF